MFGAVRDHRKRLAVALSVALAVIAVAVFAGAGAAADPVGQLYAQILKKTPGDADVVAVVDGVPVSRMEFHVATETARSEKAGLSDQEARKAGLRAALKGAAIKAEVKRRGIQVSQEEAQRATDQVRQMYQQSPAAQKAPIDADIRQSGLTPDEYWKSKVENYGQGVAVAKLIQQVQAELPAAATQQERFAHWERFSETLVDRAKVEVKDPSIQ